MVLTVRVLSNQELELTLIQIAWSPESTDVNTKRSDEW
jgi:hypothetical protein